MAEYTIIDVETNGLPLFDKPADDPAQPRICSIALIDCDADFNVQIERYHLIKPDGWVLDDAGKAAEVNGLRMAQLVAEGVPISHVLDVYTDLVERGHAFIGHHMQHESKVLRGELRRAHRDDLFDRTRTICTMRASIGVCKIPKAKGNGYKSPKLVEAYKHFYKRDFDFPHTALGDARATLELARFLKRINCLPAPAVHYAKEGTAADEALKARQGTLGGKAPF